MRAIGALSHTDCHVRGNNDPTGRSDNIIPATPCISRLLSSLLSQTYADFHLYLGLQNPDDLHAGLAKRTIDALRVRGIRTKIVEVPLDQGRLVATKNLILDAVREQFAFFVDDDYILEPDYLGELVCLLLHHPEFDCISGTAILTDEVPIDQLGTPRLHRECGTPFAPSIPMTFSTGP